MAENIKPSGLKEVSGFIHEPEGDIQEIRNLLHGYGSSASILKELIQNAEDAKAEQMDFIWFSGVHESEHPLLKSPGLLVVNDGEFREEHLSGIFRINIGTKGTEKKAIGRFGKGLKSVFDWCDAFFIIAKTDHVFKAEKCNLIARCLNPWKNWKHPEWDRDLSKDRIIENTVEQISLIYKGKERWLAFWFPLRTKMQGSKDRITEKTHGDDKEFYSKLCLEFDKLVPSLIFLRKLKSISLLNRSDAGHTPLRWKFSESSPRIPEPDAPPAITGISGNTFLQKDKIVHEYSHCGIAGILNNNRINQLKESENWPKVVGLKDDQLNSECPDKPEPHFATLITSLASDETERGMIEMRWCVFFPVGAQPSESSKIELSTIRRQITVNLHGFFFLDSERLRIDGLNEVFRNIEGLRDERRVCMEWNRILATEGVLSRLPEAMAMFVEQQMFTDDQCGELANAIIITWEWGAYKREICSLKTWRPRWRNGNEKWECIPAGTKVFEIPPVSDEIISHIPGIRSVGESAVLVTRDSYSDLPGLHSDETAAWTDELVLQMFIGVRLESDDNCKVADWINSFLNKLFQDGSLSPAILKCVASLPLLPVSDVMHNSQYSISRAKWFSYDNDGRIFLKDTSKKDILYLLKEALPKFYSYHAVPAPEWCQLPVPRLCNFVDAAKIILSQTVIVKVQARNNLLLRLSEARIHLDSEEVRLAMRLLLHASVPNAKDGRCQLFIPSDQADNAIWIRIIKQLFHGEGGVNSWRILGEESASVLNKNLQQELGVSQIDSHGILKELLSRQASEIEKLDFTESQWPATDISLLLEELYKAGRDRQVDTLSVLRRLRLHVIYGKPNQKVSISDPSGNLDKKYVLDTPGFMEEIPGDLQDLWTRFIGTANIIERLSGDDLASKVQEQLFQVSDNCVKLNWNFVVRHAIDSQSPSDWAKLILQAFAKMGGGAAAGLGQKLMDIKWLPLEHKGVINPDSIVAIEGVEEDLLHLLDPAKDGISGVLALPEWVRKHKGYSSLTNYFPQLGKALSMLEVWLGDKPDWRIGITNSYLPPDLDSFLEITKNIEELPVSALLSKLRKSKIANQEEEIDSLLKDTVWKAVLKSFDYESDGSSKIKEILKKLQNHQSRLAFDAYLGQACNDLVLKGILPELSLVNQKGNWIPADRLIWPSHNLNPAAQICKEQASLLNKLYESQKSPGRSGAANMQLDAVNAQIRSLKAIPDFAKQVKILREFIKPFMDGNIGENLPAALVAVLGQGTSEMKELLEELLQTGLRQKPEDFIECLLGEKHEELSEYMTQTRFMIEVVKGESVEVPNLIGRMIRVDLIDEIDSLLIGDPGELWWRWTYPGHPEAECRMLRLRQIEQPDTLADPVEVFKNTIENILLQVYCNNLPARCPCNIKDLLSSIADSGQTDLRRSQLYLMEIAEGRLKELGVKGTKKFDDILKEFEDARQKRVDAESFEDRLKTKANKFREESDKLIKAARAKLRSLLESSDDAETRQMLVEAVRRKMTDYQYSMSSIPMELFQNADDAVAELKEIKKSLNNDEKNFVLDLDTDKGILQIIHWGRPINQFDFPGFTEGRNLGYHQDLEKMLTLNFSDKGVSTEEHKSIVTGRFGLGFKSVFLISTNPRVISGRLAFEIRGGFYPIALNKKSSAAMREKALAHGGKDIRPTLINLDWKNEEDSNKIRETVEYFERMSPFLTIFSRGIKTLTVVKNKVPNSFSMSTEKELTGSGQITNVKVGQSSYLCFRCRLKSDERPASILFQLDANGISSLVEDVPRLWITTPTTEISEEGWALNAPFKPDAGRQRLALKNSDNHKLAAEVADKWLETLNELFDATTKNWNNFADRLGLHANSSIDSWWRQLWNELTFEKKPGLSWEQLANGGQILGWIAWAENTGAMRRFIQQRAAIPSNLPGNYSKMLKLGDMQFWVDGLLSEKGNGSFEKISGWESVIKAFPPGRTVHRNIKEFLSYVKCCENPTRVTLEDILGREIGERHRADEQVADRIGEFLKTCDALFADNGQHGQEVLKVFDLLKQTEFLAEDGYYHKSKELVCARQMPEVIEEDETLRTAFAPKAAVLSGAYSDNALFFFFKARGQLTAKAVTLADWARKVSADQLKAVFEYLINGELGQNLADELTGDWFDTKRNTSCFKGLSVQNQSEILRKFLHGKSLPQEPFSPIEEGSNAPVMDPEDAFHCVSEWWNKEMGKHVKAYEDKTYPQGLPGKLFWPGDDEWEEDETSAKTSWLILFISAALVPLGFNRIGRDQVFLKFLVDNGWLEHLLKVTNNKDRNNLLDKLDEYFCSSHFVQNTQLHFQMRQFIAFYAIGKNLESFLYSLKAAEQSKKSGVFSMALSPNANFELSGTGITAPPLYGMLGIGSCQILRELYRLGILKNPRGYHLAFTPIRKVRSLCERLFDTGNLERGIKTSEIIYNTLNKLGGKSGKDSTFNHCFDLPFQFLAENKDLRNDVFSVEFDVEAEDFGE